MTVLKPSITQTLQTIRADCLGKNRALPAQCYTDADFLALEEQIIYQQGWLSLGRADEIPEIGDYFTCYLLKEPVLVVRASKDAIAVYANVCRHRGMPVASGSGNTHRFVCPYHAWTYDLGGALTGAPLMEQKELLSDCGLPVVRSECWGGFIFATLDKNAVPLAQSLQSLHTATANYEMEQMHHIASFHEVWDCNWKSLIENFMDGYHLSVVHPESLRPLTPSHLCQTLSHDGAFTSYISNYAKTAPARECHAPGLSEDEKNQSRLFCIYPSTLVSVSPDTLVYLSLQALGVGQAQVKWGVSVYEENLPQLQQQQRIEKWQEINREDHNILSHLQAGLQSSFYEGGVLAPDRLEGCVSHFHDYLIERLANFDSAKLTDVS